MKAKYQRQGFSPEKSYKQCKAKGYIKAVYNSFKLTNTYLRSTSFESLNNIF